MPQKTASKPKPLFNHKQWQQCYESWLNSVQERSGSNGSRNVYNNVCRDFFSLAKSPDDYTRADIEQFVRRKIPSRDGSTPARPASARTQNARLTALSSFYAYAAQYPIPFRGKSRPLLHQTAPTSGLKTIKVGRRRRDLSEEELKQLFAAIPRNTIMGKRDYALFACYFWTARRRSEIARLRWGDISEVVLIEHGKPRQGHMYRYVAKGHSREIFTAELPTPAWEALKDYLMEVGLWGKMQDDQPLFVRLDREHKPWSPDRPIHANSVNAILARYIKLAGLKNDASRQVCPHSIRHTRARIQYRRNKDMMEIKELLGHENIATTQGYLIEDQVADSGAAALYSELGKL